MHIVDNVQFYAFSISSKISCYDTNDFYCVYVTLKLLSDVSVRESLKRGVSYMKSLKKR